MLGVGKDQPNILHQLFELPLSEQQRLRTVYERIGKLIQAAQDSHVSPAASKQSQQSPETFTIPIIYPTTHIVTQVFWSTATTAFNEASSVSVANGITEAPAVFELSIPAGTHPIDRLRIDLSSQAGAFYLHTLSLVDSSGNLVLDFPGIVDISSFQKIFAFRSCFSMQTYLIVALHHDPMIEMSLPAFLAANLQNGFSIRLNISAISTKLLDQELHAITRKGLSPAASL